MGVLPNIEQAYPTILERHGVSIIPVVEYSFFNTLFLEQLLAICPIKQL